MQTTIFQFDENGGKLSKLVENTVEKGEIACYEKFLLFPQCFQKACFPGASKGVVVWEWVNPLPDDKILDSSKSKEFTDDNLKFDENGRKVYRWVENIVGKGETAHYKQFLFFPLCFQKACFPGASNSVTVWEWVKYLSNILASFRTLPRFMYASRKLASRATACNKNRKMSLTLHYQTIF